MKQSKFKFFLVWMAVIAVLFSSLPLGGNVFANEGGSSHTSAGRDISARIVWEKDKTYLATQRGGQKVPIIVDGKLVSNISLSKNNLVYMKYHWHISPEKFIGDPNVPNDKIRSGDYFELPILNGDFFSGLSRNKEYEILDRTKIVNGKPLQYGSYKIEGPSDRPVLKATFNQNIEQYQELRNGYFEFEARLSKDGNLKLGIDEENSIIIKINPPSEGVDEWKTVHKLSKQGGFSGDNGTIDWQLLAGFDQLERHFKGEPLLRRRDMVIYDYLPKGIKDLKAQIKISFYRPVPENNPWNDGKNPGDPKYATPGNLSWVASTNTYYDFPEKIEKNQSDITPEGFIEEIKIKGRTQPTLGIYTYTDNEGSERKLLVAGLGESPSAYRTPDGGAYTYDYAYAQKPVNTHNQSTLAGHFDIQEQSDRSTAFQANIMRSKYLNQEVLAWNVILYASVEKIDSRYENTAHFEWEEPAPASSSSGSGPSTGEESWVKKSLSAKNQISYANTEGGATGIKRTSFVVRKRWEDGVQANKVDFVVLANGEELEGYNRTLTAPNWDMTVTGLPVYDEQGQRIEYSIRELPVPGFQLKSIVADSKDAEGNIPGFTITNKPLAVEKIDITVNKEWEGRPADSVQVTLTGKTDAGNAEEKTVITQKVTILRQNGWAYIFRNLPKFDNSKEIEYSVKEKPIHGYQTLDIVRSGNTFTIKNKEIPSIPRKNITVEKTWVGTQLQEARITLHAQVGGGEIQPVEDAILDAQKGWKHTFNNLATVDEHGNSIKYTVSEFPIQGYKIEIVEDKVNNLFRIQNIEQPAGGGGNGGGNSGGNGGNNGGGNSGGNGGNNGGGNGGGGNSETTTEQSSTNSENTSVNREETASNQETTTTTATETTTTMTTSGSEVTTESAESTTETTAESNAETVTTTEETTTTTTTTEIAFVPIPTTAPTTIPTTPRVFEFIEIDEDIPLAVRTTAPIDLEYVLIEEAIPLTGLPYTSSSSFELFIGLGMIILTIGLSVGRKL